MPAIAFTRYLDESRKIVGVIQSFNGAWITVRLKFSAGGKRIKSPALPPRKSRAAAQADLDVYAAEKGWTAWTPPQE